MKRCLPEAEFLSGRLRALIQSMNAFEGGHLAPKILGRARFSLRSVVASERAAIFAMGELGLLATCFPYRNESY